MALFGKVEELQLLLAHDSRFGTAFEYLKRCLTKGSTEQMRWLQQAINMPEKIQLENGTRATHQVYMTRDRNHCFFESHQQFIDVQCILDGEEYIDVSHISGLSIEEDYREDKDVIIYSMSDGRSRLRLRAGEAAVFYPNDGHMPGQFIESPRLMRKVVVKVPV